MSKAIIHRLRDTSYAWPALGGVVALLVLNVVGSSDFVHSSNWGSLGAEAGPFVLIGMAQAVAVISGGGGLDISLGPLAGVVNVVIVAWLAPHGMGSVPIVVAAAIVVGAAGGLLNGALIGYVRVPPIIATLGTYFIYSALALEILPVAGGNIPSWLGGMTGSIGPVPYTVIPVICVIGAWVGLTRSRFGRNLFAVGGDDRAAFTCGINVAQTRMLAYTVGGTFAGIAGLALSAIINTGDPTAGQPYTLYSITAVALGGVVLSGGRGGVVGAAAGGAILFLIQTFLTAIGLSNNDIEIGTGLTLVVALALNRLGSLLRSRRQIAMSRGEPRPTVPELLRGVIAREV